MIEPIEYAPEFEEDPEDQRLLEILGHLEYHAYDGMPPEHARFERTRAAALREARDAMIRNRTLPPS